jgi:NTE family protein
MNATILVDGLTKLGAASARTVLENFWRRVSWATSTRPFLRGPLNILLERWMLASSPAFITLALMARPFWLYQLNLSGYKPLTAIMPDSVDFRRLTTAPIHLFIDASLVAPGEKGWSARMPVPCP